MFDTGERKPEPQKAYKNRVFKKHHDKLINQMWQIRQCSLNKDDKNKLPKELNDAISQFKLE